MQINVVRDRRHLVGPRRFVRVLLGRKVAFIGAVVVVLFVVTAIFADLGWLGLPGIGLAPHNPYQQNMLRTLEHPSKEFLLGTDHLGRDLLSRIIHGTRISLLVGVVTVSLASAIGMTLGLVAGYFAGWPNMVIMRFIDALMSIPMIILAIAIAGVTGGGLLTIIIALTIGIMPTYTRLMCGMVLAAKEADYVKASYIIGAGNLRILFLHLFPNCMPPLIVLMTMNLGLCILAEAGLSFFGLGVSPPAAAWGSMVSDGYKYLYTNSLLSLAPGIGIMLIVMSFNLAGDGLRDALDPRLRGTI